MKPQNSTTSLSVVPSPSTPDAVPFAVAASPVAAERAAGADNRQKAATDESSAQDQPVDFVGSSAAVKDLFSLPYTSEECSLSVAIHNVDGTLVFDRDAQLDHERCGNPTNLLFSSNGSKTGPKNLPECKTQAEKEWTDEHEFSQALVAISNFNQLKSLKPSSNCSSPKSEALTVVDSLAETIDTMKRGCIGRPKESQLDAVSLLSRQIAPANDGANALGLPRPDDYVHQHVPPTPEPREYLSWKFHDMRLWVGSDALILRGKGDDMSKNSNNIALTVRVEDAHEMQQLVKQHELAVQNGAFLPDHQRSAMQQKGKPSYAAAAVKNSTRKHVKPLVEGGDNHSVLKDDKNKNASRASEKTGGFLAPNLGEVKLQTCIVPSSTLPAFGLLERSPSKTSPAPLPERPQTLKMDTRPTVVSPVSTVLDAYLDNIMANVPQLALCLREKGFIQSVKLLETENIPSTFLHPSTMDTSKPFGVATDEADKVFSPQVMEMNAAALLNFLKQNCTRDNSTYLLRRECGQANIHLYDISSISELKQKKWIWWLAMMSCRFAHRLRNIIMHVEEFSKRRSFRNRERALLQNALELLEVLNDMDGSKHESLAAGIRENLADTFLRGEEDASSAMVPKDHSAFGHEQNHSSPEPATSASSSQHPYAALTVDALNKAYDHLSYAIKSLLPYLENKISLQNKREKTTNFSPKVSSIDGTSSDDSDDDNGFSQDGENNLEVVASATQLFGLHEKIVNVSLRLAEIHLRNYYSSSAMQALRSAARRIADSLGILNVLSSVDKNKQRDKEWLRHVQLQFIWLWEHCGHFARSFAGDGLWRDRGHAAADDILIVLQDAESAFTGHRYFSMKGSNIDLTLFSELNPLSAKTHDSVNLHSLSGIVQPERINRKQSNTTNEWGLEEAREKMHRQKFLLREERKVIVAACLAYERAVHAFKQLDRPDSKVLDDKSFLSLLQQRLGDACNEAGKILLDQLRTELSQQKEDLPSDEAANALLASAEFWFSEALKAFEESNDLRNLVLLRCNLCQCYKLRANAVFALVKSSMDQSTHAESCLQEAANQLERAHEVLGEKTVDSILWDMVSSELAATFLVLGVRRRQSLVGSGNTPVISQSLRLSPGQERSIVEPMDRALKIYQSMGNHHQAAAVHYQLALFYSKVWTCQRDEAKTREKLAAAFTHYSAAHAFFSKAVRGNELTLCLVCLDLSNLYSSVQGEEGNAKALFCCLDTIGALATLANEKAPDKMPGTEGWYRQMETVASSVEDRVFKLLRNLVKLFDDGETKIPYKDIYRASLKAKMTAKKPKSTGQQLVLDRLSNVHEILKATDDAICELGLR